MPDIHANFAYTTVAVAPSPALSGTSLTVAAGQGALFPTAPFNCTVWPASTYPLSTNAEIVRVTARVGDVLTITRAQESSNARAILVGDQFAATITAKTLTDVELTAGNSITITAGVVDTIQDIRTTATPQFARLGIGIAADASLFLKISGNVTDEIATITNTNTTLGGARGLTIKCGQGTNDPTPILRTVNRDGTIYPLDVLANGDVCMNPSGTALPTTATFGFFYIPCCSGAPTGVPDAANAGMNAFRYDKTNHKLWVYDGGWKGVVLS